jgi:hypothetical protein
MLNRLLFIVLVFVTASCSKGNSDALFTLLEPSQTGIDFKNEVLETQNKEKLLLNFFYRKAPVLWCATALLR